MPWANRTHQRIATVYKDVFDEVLKVPNVDISIKQWLIRVELLRRNFTKRQLTILSFIITFSYFYGKESAIIPKLKDFELAGISQTKVKDELTKLVDMGVLEWKRSKDTNEFRITDPREWQTAYHSSYNDARSRELFFLNLRDAGVTTNLDALLAEQGNS